MALLFTEKHQPFGILGVDAAKTVQSDTTQLFEVYAKQVGASISNVLLHSLLENRNDELSSAYSKVHQSYLEIVDALRLSGGRRQGDLREAGRHSGEEAHHLRKGINEYV